VNIKSLVFPKYGMEVKLFFIIKYGSFGLIS